MLRFLTTISPEVWATIIIAFLGFLGIFVSQWTVFWVAYVKQHKAAKEISQINDAVNNRHQRDTPGEEGKKLYDLSWENHRNISEMGARVEVFVDDTRERLDSMNSRIDRLCRYNCEDGEGT